MNATVFVALAEGGHLWRAQDRQFGGHIVIPARTLFHICEAGSGHRVLASGVIREGGFQMSGVPDMGRFFESANQAVLRAKPQVTAVDAYRHLQFQVCGEWIGAMDLRVRSNLLFDDGLLAALERERRYLRSLRQGPRLTDLQATALAARNLSRDPERLQRYVEMTHGANEIVAETLRDLGIS